VFAHAGFTLAAGVRQGDRIRVGAPLMRLPRAGVPEVAG